MKKAIFEGMVFDEYDRQLPVVYVGDDPAYVIDDDGFNRHVSASEIDRQVWDYMNRDFEGNEDFISKKTAEMMGVDDIFSIAVIRKQLENRDEQFYELEEKGIPYDMRQYLNMLGFKVIVNQRGELVEINQPSISSEDDE